MSSKYASENARIALCNIERRVNNLNLEGAKQSEWKSTHDYLNAVVDVDDLEYDRSLFSVKAGFADGDVFPLYVTIFNYQ